MGSNRRIFSKIIEITKYSVKILKMMVSRHKYITILWIVLTTGVSVFPSINVSLSRVSIDSINKIQQDNKYLRISIIILLLIALTNVIATLIDAVIKFVYVRIKKDIDYNIQKELYSKLRDTPMEKYEESAFHNNLSVAQTAIYRNCMDIIKFIFGVIQNILTISGVIYILFSVHWSLPIALFLSTLPGIIVLFIAKTMRYRMSVDNSQANREMSYTTSLFFNRYTIKEIKLFNIGDFLINKWSAVFTSILKNEMRITKIEEQVKALGVLILQLSNVVVSVYLLTQIANNQVTLGSYVSLTSAVVIVQSALASLGANLGEIFEISLYTKALLDIIDDDAMVNELEARTNQIENIQNIEILNLKFKYPGSEKIILNNINLSIRKGEKIAIVGNNGAGKTTLVNIILGLYTRYSGKILINNADFGKIDLNFYNRKVSAILQDFNKYNYSLKENIIVGDIEKMGEDSIVNDLLNKVGLSKKVDKFKNGINTRLSKEYDEGDELSGGEWQKLAIARSMIKDSDLIVLDEPTSALDPIAELEIYDLFNKVSQGRTTIMISHRLGITRFADRIIVLQDGEIAEMGSHKQLMETGEIYKNMYLSQANWYK